MLEILKQSPNDRLYALTISPRYRAEDPRFLYMDDRRYIRKWLQCFADHYVVCPEFDVKARLHYHGIVRITDYIKYRHIKYKMDKFLGFCELRKLKTVKDVLTWLYYCKKEQHLTPDEDNVLVPFFYEKRKRHFTIKEVVPNRKSILDYYR